MFTTFRLKRPSVDKDTSIYIDILCNKQRSKFYTGLSVHPNLWNQEAQRAKPSRHYLNLHLKNDAQIRAKLSVLNDSIENIEVAIIEYDHLCVAKKQAASAAGLKNYLEINIKANGHDKEHGVFLTDYFENVYIKGLESGTITHVVKSKHQQVAASTIKSKNSILRTIKEYEKTNKRIRFSDFNMNEYNSFIEWNNKKKRSINYIGKQIKEIKVVLRHAYDAGIHNNKIYEHSKFTTPKEQPPQVYLTAEELKKLEEKKLTPTLSKYRDLFLVGCYTAMRFSDYSTLTKDNIHTRNGLTFIDKITKKTKERVIIPVSKRLEAIILQPGYFERKPLLQQKLNDHIKDICEAAKIDESVEISRVVGGVVKMTKSPKYELITTHTARRTGATLMYLAKIPPIDIMKITGHKTQESFERYVNVTADETAVRMFESDFFKRSTLTVV